MITNKKVQRVLADIIYGPVNSRRFGHSLGINLSGSGKQCSFNCPYCFRGFNQRRTPSQEYVNNLPTIDEVLKELHLHLNQLDKLKIEDWTIAGNAEPTDHPHFPEIVNQMIALRNRKYQHIKRLRPQDGTTIISISYIHTSW